MLFNEISANCSIDEYFDADNTLVTSQEFVASTNVCCEILRKGSRRSDKRGNN